MKIRTPPLVPRTVPTTGGEGGAVGGRADKAATGTTTTTPSTLGELATQDLEHAQKAAAQLQAGTTTTAALPQHVGAPSPAVPSEAALKLAQKEAPALEATQTAAPERVRAPWTAEAEALAASALQAAAGKTGDEAVRAAMAVLLSSRAATRAEVSFAVAGLDDAQPITAKNNDVAMNPCSNAKLATATFALGVLGPAHRFTTDVLQKGDQLFLKGAFDPSMTTERLVKLAERLHASGLREVGDVVLDTSAFEGDRVPAAFAPYGEQDWTYLARPEALSVNKNVVTLMVYPGEKAGDPARVEADQDAFTLDAKLETIGAGESFRVGCDELDVNDVLTRGPDGKAILQVWGTIAESYGKGKKLEMKSPAPLESFADRVRFALEQAGVTVRGEVGPGEAPKDAKRIAVDRSKPLSELLEVSLATSNAFDHEMYAAAASLALSKDGKTSLQQTSADMERFLKEELGLSEGVVMANGSGIGNANRLAADDVLKLLKNAAQDPRYRAILESLARPGETSTLMTRMVDTPAEGHLRAKTGTGEGAVALSGLVERDGKEPLVFSALVTEHKETRAAARAFLDAVGITLASL